MLLDRLYNEDDDDEVTEYLNQERDLLENGKQADKGFSNAVKKANLQVTNRESVAQSGGSAKDQYELTVGKPSLSKRRTELSIRSS